MNTATNHSTHLPLAYEASASTSMVHGTLDKSIAYGNSYPVYDKDTTSSDMGALCSELSMASLFNIDDMADPHANAGEPTNMSGWTNCDATVSTPEGAAAYTDNSQFFLDIVESALSTGDPEPASYGLCTGETQPPSTLLSLSGMQFASDEQVPMTAMVSYYPDGYNMAEYLRDMTPETCVDPAMISPDPSLCYSSENGGSPAVSASPFPSDTCYAPFSPVPSLYYSESSPELESPIQSRALLQLNPAAGSPTLPPIEEESILERTYRAVGATLVPPTPSQFPSSSLGASSSSKRKTTRRQRKTLSSTSQQTRHPTSPRPRNLQTSLNPEELALVYSNGAYRCPVAGCPYVPPASRRRLDVRRHFETHRSEENKKIWVCCGVPVEHAAEYGIGDVSGAYDWHGWRMVGGCKAGFSRRDSLIRHLERNSKGCVGHADIAVYLQQLRKEAVDQA